MPHSTAMEALQPAEEDIEVQDAPPLNGGATDSEGSGDGSVADKPQTNGAHKQEVRLEDLFNDDEEEDDEFSSSNATADHMASSPPAGPV